MTQRGSGRTYRRVLEACTWASEGKKVCFLYGAPGEAASLFSAIKAHAPSGTTTHKRVFLAFPGGGSIELRQIGSCFAGQRYDRVQTDELLGQSWRFIEAGLENVKRTLRN